MEAREHFEQRHNAQLQELQRSKEAKLQWILENADPTEDLERFETEFRRRVQAVSDQLQLLTAEDVVAKCQALKTETLAAVDYLNSCAHFLHPHTVNKSKETIASLQDSISATQERLQPRKRFAFRGGVTAKKAEVTAPAQTTSVDMLFEGISNVSGQTLTRSAEELEQTNCYQLKHLTDCTVILPGRLKAVHILNVVRCKIYVGEVSGAAHVTGCCQSSVSISCHQLRIHQSADTTFYVNARTAPIVEDVHGLLFAPYNFSYLGMPAPGSESMWSQVKDFKWLKSEPSPNWAVLPEDKRTSFSFEAR